MDSHSDNGGSVLDNHKNVTLTDKEGGSQEAGSGDKSTIDKNSATPVKYGPLAESMDNFRLRNDIDEKTAGNLDLAQSRMQTVKQKQMVRKAAWILESRKEVLERQEFAQTNLLEVLDGLAWIGIMDNLWPEEKVKMSKMAWEWRSRLERKRVLFLFQKVFPIYCKHSFERTNDWTGNGSEDAAVSFVKRCRLVCKSWKEAIEEFISLHTVSHTGNPVAHCIPQCFAYFPTLEQFFSFNQCSEHSYRGRNPFFTRFFTSAPVVRDGLVIDVQYWNELEKMLRRWGGELWTLNFRCGKDKVEMTYLFLCRFLRLTPNLKRLCFMDTYASGLLDFRRRLGQDVYGPLTSRIERNPLPELPHLRSLVFTNFAPAPLVQAALTKYGDSLEWLHFDTVGQDEFAGGYMDPGEFLSGRVLPTLKKYSCSYGTACKDFGSQTTQISHWNYQHLSLNELYLTYHGILEGAEVGNIFKTVSSCTPTLRRLRLLFNFRNEAPGVATNWQDRVTKGLKLELPYLEELELCVLDNKITQVDFLLPLVSLKTLTFGYDALKSDDSVENGTGEIQFAGYRNRLYESNLWTLLPELRLATIKTAPMVEHWTNVGFLEMQLPKITVYDREGYRKHFVRRVLTILLEFLHSQRLSTQ